MKPQVRILFPHGFSALIDMDELANPNNMKQLIMSFARFIDEAKIEKFDLNPPLPQGKEQPCLSKYSN